MYTMLAVCTQKVRLQTLQTPCKPVFVKDLLLNKKHFFFSPKDLFLKKTIVFTGVNSLQKTGF